MSLWAYIHGFAVFSLAKMPLQSRRKSGGPIGWLRLAFEWLPEPIYASVLPRKHV